MITASAPLRAAFAAEGCSGYAPPKRGMVDPPAWDAVPHARRHYVENLFSRLKDFARIALRRDKIRRSWLGFAHLAATTINLRIAEAGQRDPRATGASAGPWPVGETEG